MRGFGGFAGWSTIGRFVIIQAHPSPDAAITLWLQANTDPVCCWRSRSYRNLAWYERSYTDKYGPSSTLM